jgi:hypothetical protein
MITDRFRIGRRALASVTAAALALGAWGVVLLATTLVGSAGRPVAVFAVGGPDAALAAVLAAGGSIVEIRSTAVIAIATDPGFVLRLYEQGPLIVVRVRGAGCGPGTGFTTARRTLA